MKDLGLNRKIFLMTLFSIAMAYLESAVVVYLREIMYPAGFGFPMAHATHRIIVTEGFRELATIVMLLCVGSIAAKRFIVRFAWFIYCFAVWDIFYYVFLRVLVKWPASFFTWDILFLIPVPWTAPVLAPLITSLTMIVLAVSVLFRSSKNISVKINSLTWILLIFGSICIIFSFTWDYISYLLNHFSSPETNGLSFKSAINILNLKYIPHCFNWLIFVSGETIISLAIIIFYFKARNKNLVT